MNDFLLWFDNTKSPQIDKILAASRRYEEKFNQPANLALVHPAQFDPAITVLGLEIKPGKYVLKNHLQVGRAEQQLRLV